MFDVHVPSNNLENVKELLKNFEFNMANKGFRLCLNLQYSNDQEQNEMGAILDKAPGWLTGFMRPATKTPSMFELRRQIVEKYPNQTFMIFDCDDRFKEGSAEYYKECLSVMLQVKEKTGRPTYFGCTGFYGANHSLGNVVVPASCLMSSNCGLIFDEDILIGQHREYDSVLGGLEESLMCAIAIKHYNAIPLKRFMCPTYKKRRSRVGGQADDSYIHNMERILENSVKKIQALSECPDWVPPRSDSDVGSHTPKTFVKYAKEIAEKITILQPTPRSMPVSEPKPVKQPKEPKVPKEKVEGQKVGRLNGKKLFHKAETNPRKPNSKGFNCFEILKANPGITFEEFVAKGGRKQDVYWDAKIGLIEIKEA